jgi:hypothetical protein
VVPVVGGFVAANVAPGTTEAPRTDPDTGLGNSDATGANVAGLVQTASQTYDVGRLWPGDVLRESSGTEWVVTQVAYDAGRATLSLTRKAP